MPAQTQSASRITSPRISETRERLQVERSAAQDLQAARVAAAAGEPVDYVPLWQR